MTTTKTLIVALVVMSASLPAALANHHLKKPYDRTRRIGIDKPWRLPTYQPRTTRIRDSQYINKDGTRVYQRDIYVDRAGGYDINGNPIGGSGGGGAAYGGAGSGDAKGYGGRDISGYTKGPSGSSSYNRSRSKSSKDSKVDIGKLLDYNEFVVKSTKLVKQDGENFIKTILPLLQEGINPDPTTVQRAYEHLKDRIQQISAAVETKKVPDARFAEELAKAQVDYMKTERELVNGILSDVVKTAVDPNLSTQEKQNKLVEYFQDAQQKESPSVEKLQTAQKKFARANNIQLKLPEEEETDQVPLPEEETAQVPLPEEEADQIPLPGEETEYAPGKGGGPDSQPGNAGPGGGVDGGTYGVGRRGVVYGDDQVHYTDFEDYRYSPDDPYTYENPTVYRNEDILYQDIDTLRQVTVKSPDDIYAWQSYSDRLVTARQYREATEAYTVVIDKQPTADSYYNRGVVHKLNGRPLEAIADYTEALNLEPGHYKALSNRGSVYSELERYKEAFDDFNKAIEELPDNPTAYFNRGYTYTKLGDYEEAIADFNKAIEFRPNDKDSYLHRAKAYYKNKELDKARADLKKVETLEGPATE